MFKEVGFTKVLKWEDIFPLAAFNSQEYAQKVQFPDHEICEEAWFEDYEKRWHQKVNEILESQPLSYSVIYFLCFK